MRPIRKLAVDVAVIVAAAVIVPVVCGVVVLNRPKSGSASPEELVSMLVTPQDLGGPWKVAEYVPVPGRHVATEEEAELVAWDQFLCADAGWVRTRELADSAALTALTVVYLAHSYEYYEDQDVELTEYLVRGDPDTLSRAVFGWVNCTRAPGSQALSLPSGLGDDAAAYYMAGDEVGQWRWALVRVGDVLMFMEAYEWTPRGYNDRSFSHELFTDAVATAAGLLG